MKRSEKKTVFGSTLDLNNLLARMEQGLVPNEQEIGFLLDLSGPEQTRALFRAAARVRDQYFGPKVFFYGFLYFSTFCRNNCRFCQYRRSNQGMERYRKTPEEILEAAFQMADSGVHLIDLTLGEDPLWHEQGQTGFQTLTDLAAGVSEQTGLPVMISPGVLPEPVIRHMAQNKIHWYACYQETHNRELFAALRPDQDYDLRWKSKPQARQAGMLVEEGVLTGVGETTADLARSILSMRELGADQARVMSFVPQPGTPMAGTLPPNRTRELMMIAVMRLVLRDCLIPASLDVDGLQGLAARLNAGANVVTSIVPPDLGLAGVANASLDIEDSRRTLSHVLPILEICGLKPATVTEYREWIRNRLESRTKKKPLPAQAAGLSLSGKNHDTTGS